MTDKRQWTETLSILKDAGVPCYSFPGTAARALAAMTQYDKNRSRNLGDLRQFDNVDMIQAENILQKVRDDERSFLSADEAYNLLAAYGITAADWRIAANADEAIKAASEIGYPVVIKAEVEDIIHKSDIGGVEIDIKDGEAVLSAVKKMEERLGAQDPKFFIQKYHPGGTEIIIGAKAEEGLGHLIMFGIGGIYVEILKDVVFKLTPITAVEAKEMLSSIKAAPLLKGVRGEKGIDEHGVIEILQRLSQLVTDVPAIQEIDLNPIIAYEDHAVVVDARVSINARD
jgi:acetyltransferase